jgi:membrane-associated phospholipid phosphatase
MFLVAYAALTGMCIVVGLVIVHASFTSGVRAWDRSVDRWFVRQRSGALDTATAVGSHLAGTQTVVAVGLLVVALVWWRRRDLVSVGVIAFGLMLEVTTFVTTTLFVNRSRPPVRLLDSAPPTSSFPSGHTAAAVVLYVGLIVVFDRTWRRSAITVLVSLLLVTIPVVVGLSRLYRGMHHPSDVVVGVALGGVSLLVACTVVRRVATPSSTASSPNGRRREVVLR